MIQTGDWHFVFNQGADLPALAFLAVWVVSLLKGRPTPPH